ncbi:MAG TPA: aryl-sulfate sulfotransferase [Candidatus Fimihabitans intestinipullorum]|uniref:Aryl-sulfate sulfotransferase n=1 Tax=Candidatus Fimihabitans intestinipullorum TaxID=2840820 RepID=A0A9D1L3S8_9BACT|nr:aryl-sulfate sulfotransferase [Candidatus Fimihabitans intestinipullorum]
MKTQYKMIILIALACICSILIYYKVDKAKPAKFQEDLIAKQEKLENKFLEKTNYTMEHPNIILDPYDISPLTALVIFETSDLTAPEVTVKGKDENTTFTKTFTPSKKHILPIYGLYPDTNNEVTIECNGKKNVFYIKTDPLPEDFALPTKVISNKEELGNELYFVTPSSDGYVAAYDVNGDVRWYLNESFTWDIKRLNNGNILLSSNRLINPPYYMTGLMEMDLLGKVYYEYTLPGGYHHDVFELENGNFIVASDNFENGTVEDYIVEMDRKTGEIVKTIDLTKILPQDEGRNVNATDYDWFHNNSVWYDAATNSLTLSGRHQDAVVNLDYSTNEINWIVGSKEGWSKEMQKYFFEPDENTEFQWSQHAAMILPNGNLFVFDNGNNRSKTAENAVNAENNYSRGVIYQLDKENKMIHQIWQYGKERGSEFYSPYISDVDYFNDGHYLIHSGGISKTEDGKPNNEPAGLQKAGSMNSITTEVKDDEVIFEMQLPGNFYRAEKMSLYANNVFKTGKGTTLGSMGETKASGKQTLCLINKSINNTYKSHDIKIVKEKDRLAVTGTFKKSDKVEIILDNTFNKKVYDMIISKKPYTAMCVDIFNEEEKENGISVTKYINDEGLKGKFYIYLKINGTVYDTDLYVTY